MGGSSFFHAPRLFDKGPALELNLEHGLSGREIRSKLIVIWTKAEEVQSVASPRAVA